MKNTSLKIILTAAFLLCAAAGLYADKLIAYPVPFNPEKQTLNLKFESGAVVNGLVSVEIFDINGDHVFSRQYSSLSAFLWKGYNNNGVRVKAGLYIVKVRIEYADGMQPTDLIRILVKR